MIQRLLLLFIVFSLGIALMSLASTSFAKVYLLLESSIEKPYYHAQNVYDTTVSKY